MHHGFREYAGDWPLLGAHDPRGIFGLALGVLLGGACQLLIQVIGLIPVVLSASLSLPWRIWSPDLRKVGTIMIPAAIAGGIGPINAMINTNFATSVGPGAVTWLNYSFRLLQLPIGIFGVALASAALPRLSRAVDEKRRTSR